MRAGHMMHAENSQLGTPLPGSQVTNSD